ncbi:YfhO family protein, partial [Staphylococcus epidermidis]
RNELTYKYRRFVTPVTMRVKASDKLNIHLSQGTYRLSVKGIYGEDYSSLQQSAKDLKAVSVKENKNGYTISKSKSTSGYVVLPMVYADGMKATVNGRHEDVKKVNGIMTAIPVNKGDTHIRLTYTPPHWHLLFIMSILGIILS